MTQNTRPDLSRMETKAQFFAQYWGQRCRFWTVNGHESLSKNTTFTKALVKYSTLLLADLRQITDEDAITLGFLHGHNDDEFWSDEYLSGVGKRICSYFPNYTTPVPVDDLINVVDFLRSKGYALPWMGYTVKELIEAGYCQLKGGERE